MADGQVVFEDFSIKVMNAMDDLINSTLEEAAGTIESAAKRNSSVGKVNGGGLKNDWRHKVDGRKHEAYIGNNKKEAVYVEFGTGDYALEGKGRKGGWFIPIGRGGISEAVVKAYGFRVIHGKDGKKFAHTHGIAAAPLIQRLQRIEASNNKQIQNRFRGL